MLCSIQGGRVPWPEDQKFDVSDQTLSAGMHESVRIGEILIEDASINSLVVT